MMGRMKCGILALAITSAVLLAPAVDVCAHGHSSGHHSNSASTSYYYCGGHAAHTHTGGVCPYADEDADYYHCGGHAAHLHENGVCPYAGMVSSSTIKKVQKKLNSCGYSCGKADGVLGAKTKKALKKYQRDNGLTADGIIGSATLAAMGISQ